MWTSASKLHNVVKTVDLLNNSWDQTPCQKLKGEFEGLYVELLKSLRHKLTCSKSGVGILTLWHFILGWVGFV